ncbi:MAG: hypothetical protein Q9167_005514 [Letrouitia subvulpina]
MVVQQLSQAWVSQDGKQFDLAILVLATVNVGAALLMILNIVYDARNTIRWRRTSRNFKPAMSVHPAEVFPLIISITIVIQGVVFIVVQSRAKTIVMKDCSTTSQIVWPALWMVPYTMLVFGLETTFRALHRNRFQHQRKWHVLVCVGLTLLITIVTWIPSNVSPRRGECLASIIWWTAHYSKVGLVIGSGLMFTFVVCAGIITAQLLKTTKMDRNERIAASRAMVIPFYAQMLMDKDGLTTSQIAEVALNLLGITHLILHIFLRSNADKTAIYPVEAIWPGKRKLRLFGPSDLDMTMHIKSPVLYEEKDEKHWNGMRKISRNAGYEKVRTPSPLPASKSTRQSRDWIFSSHDIASVDRNVQRKAKRNTPIVDDFTYAGSAKYVTFPSNPKLPATPSSTRKPSLQSRYSIFPTHASAGLRTSVSTTFSEGDDHSAELLPPLPLISPTHRREISDQTSATVEIGMRLSNYDHTLGSLPSTSLQKSFRRENDDRNSNLISPLSFMHRPTHGSGSSEDIFILPIQSSSPRSAVFSPMERKSSLRVPGWLARQAGRSRSQRISARRLTMKALPPDPPKESNEPPLPRSPNTYKNFSPITTGRRPSEGSWV